MEKMNRNLAIRILATFVLTAVAFVGGLAFSQLGAAGQSLAPSAPPTPVVSIGSAGVNGDFSEIASRQGPAVVHIRVISKGRSAPTFMGGSPEADPDDPFAELFRRFQGPSRPGDEPTQALGSGFIIDSKGLILTNAHVVANADEVTVKLTDKREFKARVMGSDKLSDVALLKIDAQDLPTVRIGDPQQVKVGQWVVAIGSPFGMENTVTAGIVSARSRTLPDEGYVPFLQTDVPINPGNSGGPLFNMNGEVIGINSQIYSRTGGYQGLSFAIPIDVAMKVEHQLASGTGVKRGRMGISIGPVSAELAQSLGLSKAAGALVGSVERGSPAEKAGIQPGDVVLRFNERTIGDANELPALVADLEPGTSTRVLVWHRGKDREMTITLGKLHAANVDERAGSDENAPVGLSVRPLNAQERNAARVAAGLLVLDVDDGPAQRAGIKPGDLLIAANGEMLSSPAQLKQRIESARGKASLLVQRDDQRFLVQLTG